MMKDGVGLVYSLWCFGFGMGLMIMDESSCVEVEEEECGYCHTIYMEECKMKMVEEMMPNKVSVCKNVTRYGDSQKDAFYFKERIISDTKTSARQ